MTEPKGGKKHTFAFILDTFSIIKLLLHQIIYCYIETIKYREILFLVMTLTSLGPEHLTF